jgi:hypothetical protein
MSDLSPQGGAKRTFDWAVLIWRSVGALPDLRREDAHRRAGHLEGISLEERTGIGG